MTPPIITVIGGLLIVLGIVTTFFMLIWKIFTYALHAGDWLLCALIITSVIGIILFILGDML